MNQAHGYAAAALLSAVMIPSTSLAAVLNAASMAFQSGGSANGPSWTLASDGYVGTYITLPAPGTVTLAVQATGQPGTGSAPLLGISVDNSSQHFSVSNSPGTYTLTAALPAGTHFVRTDLSNVITGRNQSLTIQNLTVSGANILNQNTNSNALAAADTYAANFRQGNATISFPGIAPGTPVEFKLVRNAFNFEGSVTGSNSADPTSYMAVAKPVPGSTAANYQKFYNASFNTLEPANAGKWANNEPFQNFTTMSYVDTLLNYARNNHMNVRMHNLIWGAQQPAWVNSLLTSAQSSNPTTAANAKSRLMTAIANRINYYIGPNGNRSDNFQELDVLNEALRTPPYWKIFGPSGLAQIYNMAANAAAAAGNPKLRLYTNEYNVLQFSNNPANGAQDPYANWYRQNVEDIQNALPGEPTVSGVGIQYYADSTLSNHSPARIMQALENLSVTGLPISLTEFQVKNGAAPADAAQILTDTMRLMYGSPNATTMGLWDFWAGAAGGNYTAAALYDANWNLTPVGAAYASLMDQWNTDLNTTIGADGTVHFTGTFGDYDVLVGNNHFAMTFTGDPAITLSIPEPSTLALLCGSLASLACRRRCRNPR
ncbi:MAG: endo-1,4-beta-xylanase [Phycisphaerae bacterium]